MNIQEALATIAIELGELVALPHDEKIAAQLWLKLSERLKNSEPEEGQYGKLTGVVEAAARHDYLLGLFGNEDIHNETDQVLSANLAWDRILPEGPGLVWWKHLPSPITQAEIDARIKTAPPTRAALRAALINTQQDQIKGMNWAYVNFKNKEPVFFSEPYENGV